MFTSIGFFRKYYPGKVWIFFYLLSSIMTKATTLAMPYLIQRIIDSVQMKNATRFQESVCLSVVAMLAFMLFLSSAFYLRSYIETETLIHLKKQMMSKILRLKKSSLQSITLGEMLQKVFQDTEAVRPLIITAYTDFIMDMFYLGAIVGIMFRMNRMLTVLLIAIIPFFVLCYKKSVPKIEKTSRKIIENEEKCKNLLEETVWGNIDIKVNSAYDFMERKLNENFSGYLKESLNKIRQVMIYDYVSVTGIMNAATVLIYSFGGYLVLKGQISVGVLVSFSLYFSRVWTPVENFAKFAKELKVQKISLNRIKTYLQMEEEDAEEESLPPFENLTLKGVRFSYQDREILKNVDFEIKTGQMIGIQGGNGAGKSTFAQLLLQLESGYEGEIYYNDRNYCEIHSRSLREKIIYIPPEVCLFGGNVMENITLSDESEPNGFLKNSAVQRLLSLLEMNNCSLLTKIESKQKNLSSGEQKIIQILRGLCMEGHVYILDEPLNFVDKKYKEELLELINLYLKGKTVIIISHDEAAFAYCDVVYKLEKGVMTPKE